MRKVNYPDGTVILFKITLYSLLLMCIAALLLAVFAPRQLQYIGKNLGLAPGDVKVINMAAARAGGNYVRIAKIIREEMKTYAQRHVNILTSQGSLENVNMVRDKTADFALIQGGLDHEVVDGLSAVAQVGWQYVHIIVPRDSPVQQFRDLKGLRINMGPALSGNVSLGTRIFAYFWPEHPPQLVNGEIRDVERDFQEDRFDAAFVVYDFHAPIIESLMDSQNFRLIPIPEAPSIAQALPGVFADIIPAATYGPDRSYPRLDGPPHHTLKVKTLLVTRKTVSRFAVERMLNVLFSPRFAKKSKLPELNEEMGRNVHELPLHEAAERYYRRNEPITADRFEIGSFFLATVLFLGSITNFISRQARERHQDRLRERIVPYFEELLSCSKALASATDVDELETLLKRMMETQREAESSWLRGKLDTEHMENLYAIYGIHCSNAFQKVQQMLQARRLELLAKEHHTQPQPPVERPDNALAQAEQPPQP